ncbi:MAG: universal stress protein, partial [Gemmatimonadaceae bacterium]|nr:universal stress protein [Gemmatimonadaceae bacterium]
MRLARVMVAVDFSGPSLAAARWAARELAPGAEIVLAHVIRAP